MKHREKLNTFRTIVCCLALIGIPVGLIFKQPDLSTAIVVLLIFCVAMFIGGLSYKVILGVLAAQMEGSPTELPTTCG